MRQPRHFQEKLDLLKTVSADLNQMLTDGTFYRLSFANRSAWIRRVKKLYNGLRGPIGDFNLKPLLAAGAVSAAAMLATGCPAPDGGTMTPSFATAVTNPFNLANVGSWASPCSVDIDNDGDLDAFIGNNDGNTFYFQNTGTASAPVFAAPVTNPFNLTDVGNNAAPRFTDIDNDGTLDAFIGNRAGNFSYFHNTGTAAAPAFAAPVSNPNGLTNEDVYAVPCFADLDNDGDLDALMGGYFGDFNFFRNTGNPTSPAFDAAEENPFGLTYPGYYSAPCLVDIDNDGDLDALVGASIGNTFCFQNTGTASSPVFAAAVTNPFSLTNAGFCSAPCFVDMDNDGDLDAFIGNYDGNTLYFRNTAR